MRRLVMLSLLMLVVTLVVLPTALGRLLNQPSAVRLETDGADTLEIKVYLPKTGRIETMPLAEYLVGVVAAEMPQDFADEALKAQFIVARTYAAYRMHRFAQGGRGGCSLNPAADVCADIGTGQAFISRADAEQRWGKAGAASWLRRLEQLRAETDGVVVRYRGQLIDPLYHSVSGVRTENAEEYYGRPAPYLVSVDDHWGGSSPKLIETKRFSAEEFAKAVGAGNQVVPVTAVKASPTSVKILERTSTGRVKTVKVGTVTVTGREFRERLGLRSTDFTVTVGKTDVTVTTRGYGHGVGLSQYGANGMAAEGKSHAEILKHYYQGVVLSQLFAD